MNAATQTSTVTTAAGGGEAAFAAFLEPHRRELLLDLSRKR
jgi:hypothetical protein